MSKKPENLNTIRQSCGSRVVVNGVSCISPIIDRKIYDSSLLYQLRQSTTSIGYNPDIPHGRG